MRRVGQPQYMILDDLRGGAVTKSARGVHLAPDYRQILEKVPGEVALNFCPCDEI